MEGESGSVLSASYLHVLHGEILIIFHTLSLSKKAFERVLRFRLSTILFSSERGGIFTGIGEFIRSGEFIRRAKRVPGEAREE